MHAAFVIIFGAALMLLVVVLSVLHRRYYRDSDGRIRDAWAVYLPGFITIRYAENTVGLGDWVGTRFSSLLAEVVETGEVSSEVTAALGLQAIGLYLDHKLVLSDGHWVLHRPARTERHFTWAKPYRLTRGRVVALRGCT